MRSCGARPTERRTTRQDDEVAEADGKKALTIADLFNKTKTVKINLILRADTQGSLEAIKGVIAKESEAVDEVDVEVMLDAVGAPTE